MDFSREAWNSKVTYCRSGSLAFSKSDGCDISQPICMLMTFALMLYRMFFYSLDDWG